MDNFISVFSLGEIFKGIAFLPESHRRRNLQQWVDEVLFPWFGDRILPVDKAVAQRLGELAGFCQKKAGP